MTRIYITYNNNTAEAKDVTTTIAALTVAKILSKKAEVKEIRVLNSHLKEIAYYAK